MNKIWLLGLILLISCSNRECDRYEERTMNVQEVDYATLVYAGKVLVPIFHYKTVRKKVKTCVEYKEVE